MRTWARQGTHRRVGYSRGFAIPSRQPHAHHLQRHPSRGVFGAVRCLTDARVREANEKYLASGFRREFAMLLRVPVVRTRHCRLTFKTRARGCMSGHRTRMVVSERRQPRTSSLKKVRQQSSHAALSQDVSRWPAPRCDLDLGGWTPSSFPHPDRRHAFSRPSTWRPGSAFCSSFSAVSRQGRAGGRAGVDFARGESTRRRDSGEVDPPEVSCSNIRPGVQKANADRKSDLSAKRNIGLLLARLHGWNKIVFVDDDITLSRTDNIARLAGQLDRHQVAGMIVRPVSRQFRGLPCSSAAG